MEFILHYLSAEHVLLHFLCKCLVAVNIPSLGKSVTVLILLVFPLFFILPLGYWSSLYTIMQVVWQVNMLAIFSPTLLIYCLLYWYILKDNNSNLDEVQFINFLMYPSYFRIFSKKYLNTPRSYRYSPFFFLKATVVWNMFVPQILWYSSLLEVKFNSSILKCGLE